MSEQNKENARKVLKAQMDRAFNTALAFENAGRDREAENELQNALFMEDALRQLEEVPAALCEPDLVNYTPILPRGDASRMAAARARITQF